MTTTPLDTAPPVSTLDPDLVTSALLTVVMLSAQLRHERPEGTARDYLSTIDQPEARFVRDVLSRGTDEICDRWFGGRENACLVLMRHYEGAASTPLTDEPEEQP